MHIRPTRTVEDLEQIQTLSWEIFHEHYDTYMDPDHVEFYLNKYQTVEALKQQQSDSCYHYLIQKRGKFVGFVTLQELEQSLRLSKLYIHKDARGWGLGEDVMDFVEDEAEERQKNVIDLIVNRRNVGGIKFYQRMKFVITEELVHHYENGHSEEDYLMTKELK